MIKLVQGDRVEHVSCFYAGTVEYADDHHVRVKWDDGKVGLLFYDGRSGANARHLQRLAKTALI